MTTPTAKIDAELVRTLAELLNETGLSEIEYDTGSLRLRVARQLTAVAHAPMAMPGAPGAPVAQSAALDAANHPGAVTSPMVGVAYLSPEPSAAHFIKVGDRVTEGQTLCLIEAMKTFNPIRAPKGGLVTQILIGNGQPVEFGEPLVIVE
ncbi:MAG: acetyl-CoA carboxylase biotin carboxyl carrier protein [Alphaproteobacteria bacterium]|nr:acetyl-CoA carboxylase biotin carboxyl carrier protein [Alphaproteobacteria bacterium]